MQHAQVLQQDRQTYSQEVKLWQQNGTWVTPLKRNQRKQHKVVVNTRSIVPRLGTRQRRGIVGKANRIVDGKRNANIPVDMSDHFYDHGNEYCRYLITDPRSDRQGKKRKPFEKLV